MPQFDPTTFAPQLVWLGITFLALYLLMSKLIIPRVSGILAQREDRIDGNLQRAEALKEEAAQVLAAYQKAIADARAQAQAALAKAAPTSPPRPPRARRSSPRRWRTRPPRRKPGSARPRPRRWPTCAASPAEGRGADGRQGHPARRSMAAQWRRPSTA
jgi:hypothetical protein